ncbi:MAG: choice-of-anchor A family protein, partial [Ignavibacteriales bacterium]
FTIPTGYTITTQNAGTDDAVDSDIDAAGKTICTALTAGETDLTWDAGIYVPVVCNYKIGDYVWHDSDVDGVQDEGEAAIPGVKVELLQNGNVIASTITNANGLYYFTDLCAGTYGVRVAESNYATGGVLESTSRVKWYVTKKDIGTDDKDSDALLNEIVYVTITNADNLTIDFGYYKTCISLVKTASPAVVKPGDQITYTFVVENCGDIVLAGGVDVKDPLLNPVAPYIIEHFTLNPGAVKTFTKTYTATEDNCGELKNTATAEGHPQDNSAYVTDQSSATVTVNCGETCVEDWSAYFTVEGAQNNSKAICKIEAGKVVVTGHVDLTPNPSKAFLQLAWRIVAPTDNGYDLTTHYQTIEINGSTDFTVEADWPGIKCDDQFVEVHVGVNVLDCDGNPIHNGTGFDYYWYPWVCPPPSCETADLELTKTADKVDAKNGDFVTYTITVKNNGSSDATGVAVKDVLPVGVEYQSSSTSLGGYDNNTGIWTIGDLASGATATLTITVKVKVDQINNGTFDLGPATGFNLFILEDLTQPSSDTEGKVAVGGNATLGGYSVGDKLTPTDPPQDVLIVGGYLQYTSGRVYNGNVVVPSAASTNLPIYAVSIEEGELRFDTPIDFPAASAYLTTLSTTLSNYVVNGTTVFEWGGLFLTGTSPFLNVFHVSGAELSVANNFEIDVPNGSVVVINVDGTTVAWMGGLVVKGTDKSNVIYNFYEASSLTIHGIDVRGSILAPFADLYYPAGVVNGQVIAKSMTGSGQFNNTLFLGNIPAETNIINIAEISAAAIYDPDSTPNNGITTEDDYGKAIVTVKNDGSNKSESGSGSSSDVMSWESVGNVAASTVLSFTNDNSGNFITGTSNGNIYLTQDNGENWEALNTDNKIGAVWSLLKDNNGKLFAGTESGAYSSADNGKTWIASGLTMKDVRSIVSDASGNLFAGIWGEGVFQSSDNGKTWNAINAGLLNTAIQSLIVNDNDGVLAATYGAGVSKYSASEGIWTNMSVGNDYIWTLAKNSKGQIFAGTYGSGLYQSQNEGTWTKLENGLPAEYIYSITFDSNDKVYVSSLANGVFSSENDGITWEALGMGGKGVSTIIADKITNKIIAGTNDGNIYRSINSVTDVKNNSNEIPTEFKLAQNYPNPFNPSTTIEFAVAKREMVHLAVYDVLGQLVKVLVNGEFEAGNYNVSLNASELTSGVYIYKLTTPSVSISKKMILQK